MRTTILVSVLALVFSPAAYASPRAPAHRPAARVPERRPYQIPVSGTLGAADLVAIARLHVAAKGDQFRDDPTLAYVGREFTLTLPASGVSVRYDRESHTLRASTNEFDDAIVLASDVRDSQFVGQNSYGAKAIVTDRRGNEFGIWLPGESYSRKPITYVATMDGEKARDLSAAIRLRVSGRITKAEGVYAETGSAVFHKYIGAEATVDDPTAAHVSRYLLSVSFSRAEWIDSRSGAVIAEATIPAP